MSFSYSNNFWCLSIGLIAFLLFAVFRYSHRERFVSNILKLPDEKRESFLKSEKNIVRLFKIALWPTIVLLIVFPLVMFFSYRESFLATTVGMVLFVVATVQEYLFRRWLINALETREIPK